MVVAVMVMVVLVVTQGVVLSGDARGVASKELTHALWLKEWVEEARWTERGKVT